MNSQSRNTRRKFRTLTYKICFWLINLHMQSIQHDYGFRRACKGTKYTEGSNKNHENLHEVMEQIPGRGTHLTSPQRPERLWAPSNSYPIRSLTSVVLRNWERERERQRQTDRRLIRQFTNFPKFLVPKSWNEESSTPLGITVQTFVARDFSTPVLMADTVVVYRLTRRRSGYIRQHNSNTD